jgi:hypothetical protein
MREAELLEKIYPNPYMAAGFSVTADIRNTYSIHIFPEGFGNEADFRDAAIALLNSMISVGPFKYLNSRSQAFVSCYIYWITEPLHSVDKDPVSVSGPNGPNLPIGVTNFDTYGYYDPAEGEYKIGINTSNFFTYLQNTTLNVGENLFQSPTVKTLDYLGTSNPNPFHFESNAVTVILTPSTFSNFSTSAFGGLVYKPTYEGRYFKLLLINTASFNGKFLARYLAEAMGLHYEGSYSNPQKTDITIAAEEINLIYAPNLVYLPSVSSGTYTPTPSFKWNTYLSEIQITSGIPISTTVPSIDSKTIKLGLYKGGGGFINHVFRSGPRCLMESRYNDKNFPPTQNAYAGFCPVCFNYIKDLLTRGPINIFDNDITLDNQISKFDSLFWNNRVNTGSSINGLVYDSSTNATSSTTEYWTYKLLVNDQVGLKLTDIKVKNQQRDSSRIVEEVMDAIEFKDIQVWFDDDVSPSVFPINLAFMNGKVSLEVTESGSSVSLGSLFQKGIKLTMTYEYDYSCIVTIAFSVVFRGRAADFDPLGAAYATKFYPQISFTWKPGPVSPKTVRKFSGTVSLTCRTHHSMTNPTCMPTGKNFVELFTDTNAFSNMVFAVRRKKKYRLIEDGILNVSLPLPFAEWAFLFDYFKAYVDNFEHDAAYDDTRTFVHGPDSSKFFKDRLQLFTYNPIGYLSINNYHVAKLPRQGAFDNIHVVGDMGQYNPWILENTGPGMTAEPQKIIAAPFCAEDCIHLHVRWGNATPIAAKFALQHPSDFKGWSANTEHSLPNTESGQCLVPPNQEVKVRAVNPPESGLLNKVKIVDYNATIFSPRSNSKNVILEQGAAYAVEANTHKVSLFRKMFSIVNIAGVNMSIVPDPIDSTNLDDYEFMAKIYGRIRFTDPINDTQVTNNATTGIVHSIHSSFSLEDL